MHKFFKHILLALATLLFFFIPQSAWAAFYPGTPISIGQQVTGSLDTSDHKLQDQQYYEKHLFSGTAGQRVLISLSSPDFDALLRLQDATGKTLTLDDDEGDGTGACISDYTLPADGTYIIQATSSDPNEIGPYTLSLNLFPTMSAASISIGQTISDNLSPTDAQLDSGQHLKAYTFVNDSVSQALSIEMTSTGFDTYLWLLDNYGRVMAANNDHNGTNSRISFVPQYVGNYTIWASSNEPSATGAFTLIINKSSLLGAPEPISSGYSASDTLSKTSPQLSTGEYANNYIFNGISGQSINLNLSTSAFKHYLRLLDSQGNLIKSTSSGSISNLSLPASGTYVAWATSIIGGNTGDYNFSYTATTVPSGSIAGKVTNKCSGADLSGITITTNPLGVFTLTDSGGNYTLDNLLADTYSLTASAAGYAGSTVDNVVVTVGGTTSVDFALVTGHNPVLNPISDIVVNETKTVSFTATATDEDGDTLAYTITGWQCGSGISGPNFSYHTTYEDDGVYTVRVTVDDGACGTDYQVVNITVLNVNRPPVLDTIADITVDEGQLVTFTASATDPDGDPITYTYSGWQAEGQSGDTYSYQTGSGDEGQHQLTVTAKDNQDGSDSQTVNVTVNNVLVDWVAVIRDVQDDTQNLLIYRIPDGLNVEVEPEIYSIMDLRVNGGRITAMTAADTNADGQDEIVVLEEMPTGEQSIVVIEAPAQLGDTPNIIASLEMIGKVGTNRTIVAIAGMDIDGDGRDEIALEVQTLRGTQRLIVVKAPRKVDNRLITLASIRKIGHRNRKNVINIAGLDIDGDNVDELVFLRQKMKGKRGGRQDLLLCQAPQRLNDKIVLKSSYRHFGGNSRNNNVIFIGGVNTDQDGIDELVTITQKLDGQQQLLIHSAPTSVGQTPADPLANDLSFGDAITNKNIGLAGARM